MKRESCFYGAPAPSGSIQYRRKLRYHLRDGPQLVSLLAINLAALLPKMVCYILGDLILMDN